MSRIVLVVSLGFAALCAWTAPSRASFVFAGEGLARNCYLIAEYGYGTGSKEVTPLDVCDAALAETIDTDDVMAEARDRIAEVELNPVAVRAKGEGAVALDLLMVPRGGA